MASGNLLQIVENEHAQNVTSNVTPNINYSNSETVSASGEGGGMSIGATVTEPQEPNIFSKDEFMKPQNIVLIGSIVVLGFLMLKKKRIL